MGAQSIISFRDVNHWYGEGSLRKQALQAVTADFFPGEIALLSGPSGSGKTTALTLAGGLRSVQEGSLTLFGEELNGCLPKRLMELRRQIGFIFQHQNLLESLTALENVQMAFAVDQRVNVTEARQASLEALAAVNLQDHVYKHPSQLSGGQKQRVGIARALVRRPAVVLADEPTASLDKKSGREVVQLLQKLARQRTCAILLVTHDNRILDVADRMLTLEDGRLSSSMQGVASAAGQMLNSLAHLNRNGHLPAHIRELDEDRFVNFLDRSTQDLEELLHVLDSARRQVSGSMLDQLLAAATFKVAALLNADRGTIFLMDVPAGMLRSKVAQSDGQAPLEIAVPITQGIAGHVARTGAAINLTDAYGHPEFNREADQRTGYRTRSMLCLPLRNRAGAIFGVVQLLNSKSGVFTDDDGRRLGEFLHPIGLILETCAQLIEAKNY